MKVRALVLAIVFGLLFVTAGFGEDAAKAKTKTATSGESTTGTPASAAPDATATLPSAPAPQTKQSKSFWTSRGENTPAVEVFAGYQYGLVNPPGPNFNAQGGTAAVLANINSWIGLTADFSDSRVKGLPSGGTASVYTFLFGPQFSSRTDKATVFAHGLAGAARLNSSIPLAAIVVVPTPTPTPTPNLGNVLIPRSLPQVTALPIPVTPAATTTTLFGASAQQNSVAMALGGGVDVKISKHFGWRLIEADYLMTKFNDGKNNLQNNFRAATGVIFRFGEGAPPPPPNHPPVVSLAPNPTKVFAESGDMIVVQATASDPDNDPLTYAWSTSSGKVEGSGSVIRWNSAGLAPGTYTVTTKVDDGRGGTASASTDVMVEPRPNRPPTISCGANPTKIEAGQSATITSTASDPDNDPLTYSYASSGGKINGTGSSVQFDSTGVAPGTYTVICRTDDGRGGKADSKVDVIVQKPAEQIQLETKLSLHSIYFPTAQPTVKNPDGGLLASQQRTMVLLAGDFKKYLTYKPDAHLILQGHADPRGTEEYNKALSERRVARTKAFLVEQGVSGSAIETQGLGEEQPMSVDQVKQAVNEEQGLTPAQKTQLEKNAKVLALAGARRVDITLSTTGQTSTRTYPFNAEDALNLINPKGTGGGAVKKPAGTGAKPAPKAKPAAPATKPATKAATKKATK